ncbi:MAG: hypothetical protein FJ308_20470 [Planctomycetes bacterium]|nr:hypothetical protein [Planctomycetota bacterium]
MSNVDERHPRQGRPSCHGADHSIVTLLDGWFIGRRRARQIDLDGIRFLFCEEVESQPVQREKPIWHPRNNRYDWKNPAISNVPQSLSRISAG